MVGRTPGHGVPQAAGADSARRGWWCSGSARGRAVRDVSFAVRRGEVLALTGLVGAGRTETARLIFGADRRDSGHDLAGRPDAADPQPAAGHRRRDLPADRGPQVPGAGPEPKRPGELRAAQPDPLRPLGLPQQPPREAAACDRFVEQLQIKLAGRRPSRRHAVRRQPAEGGAGQVAGAERRGA